MARRVPKYRRHRKTGARVTIEGKDIYLGKYGTQESLDRYAEVIAKWRGDDVDEVHSDIEPTACLVSELVLAYLEHAKKYYGDHGSRRSTANNIKPTLRSLVDLFGDQPAALFGPLKLQELQQHWIDKGHSRTYVNDQTGVVRRMFKYGVSQELLPPSVYQALMTVANLSKGRTQARETPPIEPIDDETVDATIDAAHEALAAMIRIQRLTGMRPGEVCQLRPCDIDRTGDVWWFTPAKHKTQHHGKRRVIAIGPKAQAVLTPFLLRAAEDYCFRPCDISKQDNARLQYTTDGYRQALWRACDRAGVERWSPNRLRHTAGTEVRKQFGIEATQVTLGHARADVTQVYAERDQRLAQRVAKEIG